MIKLANAKVKLIMLSLVSVVLIGCSSNVPKKPAKPKGKWYVINQEQRDIIQAEKAKKAK